jgi:hypothetical protein
MPIPPSNSNNFSIVKVFTSFECIFERESIENSESFLRACSEAALILVEIDE